MLRFGSHRVSGVLAGLVIGGLIAFPLGVIASHEFSDVPDTNTYHADIAAVANAGVTTGCGDGSTYCPDDFVTREQMAAFMNRLGALGNGKTPVVNADRIDGVDSSSFVRTDVELTGTSECSAAAALPQNSEVGWGTNGNAIWATTTTNGIFRCEVKVPHGATVTEVRWWVFDSSATEYVDCSLDRAQGETGLPLASASTSAEVAPLVTTLIDSTITAGLVDQASYDYFSKCTLTGLTDTRFFGVAVDYTLLGPVIP